MANHNNTIKTAKTLHTTNTFLFNKWSALDSFLKYMYMFKTWPKSTFWNYFARSFKQVPLQDASFEPKVFIS